jgi:adenylate kinase family enzyme
MPDHRIVVVGSSCCGKTTFAKQLAASLQIPHIELDALHWGPNWQPRPVDEFRRSVADAVSGDQWLVDGNYSMARDTFWPRATQIIWLNYSFPTVMRRALRRGLRRSQSSEQLYNNNRESLAQTFFSRDSILWWIIKTFNPRRRAMSALREQHVYPHLTWTELQTPAAAEKYLQRLV